MKENCTKIIAVRMARNGITRGVVDCPVCEFGHSIYDVIKQPDKYIEEMILVREEEKLSPTSKNY